MFVHVVCHSFPQTQLTNQAIWYLQSSPYTDPVYKHTVLAEVTQAVELATANQLESQTLYYSNS